jgi:hypothetical protein
VIRDPGSAAGSERNGENLTLHPHQEQEGPGSNPARV